MRNDYELIGGTRVALPRRSSAKAGRVPLFQGADGADALQSSRLDRIRNRPREQADFLD